MQRDIEIIIEKMQASHPTVQVEQLKVTRPADDDGIWFFAEAGTRFEVQLESHTGMCPFVIETDENDARYDAKTTHAAIVILRELLHLKF